MTKEMRLLILLIGLITSKVAYADVCFNLFGCVPKSYGECLVEATKRPTDFGVKLARDQCSSTWLKPVRDQEARDTAAAAEHRASAWLRLFDSPPESAEAWVRALGPADLVMGPWKCALLKDRPAPRTGCYTYAWHDKRRGRIDAEFLLQVMDDPSKTTWAAWRDSQGQ